MDFVQRTNCIVREPLLLNAADLSRKQIIYLCLVANTHLLESRLFRQDNHHLLVRTFVEQIRVDFEEAETEEKP